MKKKIAYILVCMLVFTTFAGAMSSTKTPTKSDDNEPANMAYSHTILAEYGTYTGCVPCKYAHQALKNLYAGGWHPFYYVTFVYDKNTHAYQRIKNELGLIASPTVFWDGDWRKDVGGTSAQNEMARYNTSIIVCGNRDVADIDLTLDVEWLGAVNPGPEMGATNVSIATAINWTITAINIDVTVENNEINQYNGHLHVYVTEINSTLWNDKFGNPYTFEFKDYAFNENIGISGGSTWSDSTEWDGLDYNDGHGHTFENTTQDNTMVIAAVFDSNTDYVDETAGFVAGVNTDPKTFDIYFGNTTPPAKVESNLTYLEYGPGILEFNTTYYWKIVMWDNQSNPTDGPLWSFITRGEEAPSLPYNESPPDASTDVPLDSNLSWSCEDPDGDEIFYDVYFGKTYPPYLAAVNLTEPSYTPMQMDFNTTYYWQIVARDRYLLETIGPMWIFTTEEILPPNEPSGPFPESGSSNIYIDANLSWIGGDPNSVDTVTYHIYFEKNDPYPAYLTTMDPLPATQKEISFNPGTMEKFQKYYWQIIAFDNHGLSTVGPVWNFTTGENDPPDTIINGPSRGKAGEEHEFTFSAIDPEDENVSLQINWGDLNVTEWLGPYESGEEIMLKHSWSEEGDYTIKAKAKDIWQHEGEESEHKFANPKNKRSAFMMFHQFLQKLIQWFPLLEKVFSLFPVFNRIMNLQ